MRTLEFLVSANGSKEIRTAKGEQFLNIMNPTGYGISIYRGSSADLVNRFDFNPIYTNRSIPLPSKGQTEDTFTLSWSGGSGEDKFIVILSEDNLGVNQTLVSPGGGSSVSIVGDGVGLARQNQLPAALTGTGDLKIALQEDNVGLLKVSALNMDVNKNVGVNIENSVPVASLPALVAGAAHIGEVGVSSLPALPTGANVIGSVDLVPKLPLAATAGIVSTGQVSVGTAATVIFNEVVNGDSIAIQNTDGANALFIGVAGVTVSTGFKIPPNGIFDLDVVSGSTIVIYGVAAAAVTVCKMVIN